ncbi:MAG: hypothetical protein U9R06_02905 [Patescibacteria group bacterium]|nr:hypothetical protein [Patescibacteria group bacterium]
MNIFLGLLTAAVGFMIVAKTEWLLRNFGRIDFFDRHLGSSGGSRLGYKIIGLIAIFIGILTATNLINAFVLWVLSPLLKQNSFTI